jgi:hypothetical protein
MSAIQTQSVPQDKFLTMAANLLYKAFFESSRTQAKNLYKELVSGETRPLTTVRMEDKSTVRFDVALEYSEFIGAMSFGAFRTSLTLLINSLGETLEKGKEITVFSSHDDPNSIIFGVTSVTREIDDPNVMVLGANMAGEGPSVLLRLMYLDHKQFMVDAEETA